MKKIFLGITIILFVISINNVFSQEDILRPKGRKIIGNQQSQENKVYKRNAFVLGLEGGINYNMYSADKSYLPELIDPASLVTESGSGISPYFGISLGYEFSEKFAMHLRINYDSKYFENSKDGNIDITDVNTGEWRQGRENHSYDISVNYAHIALDFRYNFTKQFFGTFGLFLQNPLSVESNYHAKMLSPDAWYSINNETTVNLSSTENNLPSRVGIDLGIGYKYEINNGVYLVPHLRYQYSATLFDENYFDTDGSQIITVQESTVNVTNQALNSIQLGLALWFDL